MSASKAELEAKAYLSSIGMEAPPGKAVTYLITRCEAALEMNDFLTRCRNRVEKRFSWLPDWIFDYLSGNE